MSEARFSNIRKNLRKNVRSVWNTDDGFEAQEKLKQVARTQIEKEYEKCAREVPAREFPECLEKVASNAGLGLQYRKLWGTA